MLAPKVVGSLAINSSSPEPSLQEQQSHQSDGEFADCLTAELAVSLIEAMWPDHSVPVMGRLTDFPMEDALPSPISLSASNLASELRWRYLFGE